MKNTLLFQVWESLSAVEIRRLDKFLNSPYHNKHKGVLRLFAFLKKHGHKPESELSREKVFAYVFPKEKYEDLKLRHVMSYMLKALEAFLVLENPTSTEDHDFLLLDAYMDRELEGPFLAKWNSLNKDISKEDRKTEDWHLRNFRLHLMSHQMGAENESGEDSLQAYSDELDAWFLIRKLRAGSQMLRDAAKNGTSYSNGLLDPVIITAKIMGLLKPEEIAIHFHAFMCLSEPDDFDHYLALKALVQEDPSAFAPDELREVLEIAIEFCDSKAAQGIPKYLNDAFDLFELGIESGAFLDEGRISPQRLKDLVDRSISIRAYSWVLEVLDTFEQKISGGYSRSHYLLQRSRIQFAQEDFPGIIETLSDVFIKSLPIRLEAEILLMKAYYEEEEYDRLEKLIASFLRGLHRKETPQDRKKSYRNFARNLKKFVRTRDDEGKLQELRASIQYEDEIAEQEWLVEKINEVI